MRTKKTCVLIKIEAVYIYYTCIIPSYHTCVCVRTVLGNRLPQAVEVAMDVNIMRKQYIVGSLRQFQAGYIDGNNVMWYPQY